MKGGTPYPHGLSWFFLTFLLALPLKAAPDFHSVPQTDEATQKKIHQVYLKAPLAFEKNEGQTDPQVRFLARGLGYRLFLTPAEAVLRLNGPHSKSPKKIGAEVLGPPGPILRMRLQGGNRLCRMEGEGPLPGKSNYFIGRDPDQWKVGVGQYAQVEMKEVYPGIDLVYYGQQEKLEYDFIVGPGADPKAIRLKFTGMDSMRVDADGNVVLKTKTGEVLFQVPAVYQEEKGQRTLTRGRFVSRGRDEVGFEVGNYDQAKPLIIDPTLSYSTYMGGSAQVIARGIAVDPAGNAYITGSVGAGGFPTTGGAYQTTYGGSGFDAFVTKLNATGSALVYSTYLGGNGDDMGYGIAVDPAGNAYVAGFTGSSNFPTTGGAFQTTNGGGNDAFVTKLDPSGAGLVYSTYLGGATTDWVYGITVNGTGNAYVTGSTNSTNFPVTGGAYQTTDHGGFDAFITELNPAGTGLVYSTYLGGGTNAAGQGPDEAGYGIALDAGGNVYVVGNTWSNDFPTTAGAFQTVYGSCLACLQGDDFVAKLNPTGTALVYSTFLGGNQQEGAGAAGIAVDAGGNAYVAGSTGSSNFPTTAGAFQTGPGNSVWNVFVTKLNPAGTGLVYSTYLAGSAGENGNAIVVDASGDAYVTGLAQSTNFPTTAGAYQTTMLGINNAFLTELNPTGTALVYSTYLGGDKQDEGYGVAMDSAGNVYVAGETWSSNFPTTAGVYQTTFNGGGGNYNAFVSKFANPSPTPTNSPTPSPTNSPTSTPTQTPTGTLTPLSTWTPTPTPTGLPCGNPLYVSRNLYRPLTDQPALFVRVDHCRPGSYSLKIYNSAGELVRTLRDRTDQPEGMDQVDWDGKNNSGQNVASGVYLIQMVESSAVHRARVIVVR